MAAVIILKRIDFVTSPFFKSLSLGLMNDVVSIFQNKAHSWQVHNTLHDGCDGLLISAGTHTKKKKKKEDVSTSDRIELSVHDEMSPVISNRRLPFKSAAEVWMFRQEFKVLYCFVAVRAAAEEMNESATSGVFIFRVRNLWCQVRLTSHNFRPRHRGDNKY